MKQVVLFLAVTIFILLLASPKWGMAQENASPNFQTRLDRTDAKFAEINQSADSFFQTVNVGEGSKYEETYKHYTRWKAFWQHRVAKAGKSQTSYKYAQQYWKNQLKQHTGLGKGLGSISVCQSSNYDPNWQLLGPKKKYDYQSRGRIECLAIHPNDTSIIYAGTNASGLYKTTDHGQTWQNITDVFEYRHLACMI